MKRESTVQRQLRERAEEERERANERASYASRLMNLLERANQFDFNLTVANGMFVLVDMEVNWRDPYTFSYSFDEESNSTLHTLRFDLAHKEELRAEQLRVQMAKDAALAKLTSEERKLLGL